MSLARSKDIEAGGSLQDGQGEAEEIQGGWKSLYTLCRSVSGVVGRSLFGDSEGRVPREGDEVRVVLWWCWCARGAI